MPPTRAKDQFERRPTLPSIHTLNLPLLSGSAVARPALPPNAPHKNYDHSDLIRNFAPQHARNFSTSSSATNDSRNSSPVLQHARKLSTSSSVTNESRTNSPAPTSPENNPRNPFASGKPVRLRACSIAEAEAIFIVKPRVAALPAPSGQSNPTRPPFSEPHMLIFGSNVDDYRNNPRPLPRGTRVHPYRIVRSPSPSNGRVPSIVIHPIPPPRRR